MKKTIIVMISLVVICIAVWADLNDEFIEAAYNGDLAVVERLLEAGADVNLHDDNGKTALNYAVESGYTDTVELLKDAGAVE